MLSLVTALVAVAGLAACDADGIIVGPGGSARDTWLTPGLYTYRAWSDVTGRVAWSGVVELHIGFGGRLTGWYRLPWQCVDGRGFEADCVGHVGGSVRRDGTVRFGFDEGWLRQDGQVNRFSEVTGRWRGRFLGYDETGTFELVPR